MEGSLRHNAEVIRLDLLSGFAARDGRNGEVVITSRKAQALLAILALHPGQKLSRQKLTGLLWSDRGEPQARSSLRHVLTELRKALPKRDPPPLMTESDQVWLDPEAVEVDAVTLERLIGEDTLEALEEAAELCRGEFLDGLDVRDAAFEEWLRIERERLRSCASQVLGSLLDRQTGDEAIATGRRLLALDPLKEATHRALIRLYADAGDRSMAIKQYNACCEVLQAELGLKPETGTQQLADEIQRGDVKKADSTSESIPAETPRAANEPLPLPDKPSIAVLPFVNMSGDPEQEYFSDGITEDIITELSRFRDLFVIARHSSFQYKGQSSIVEVIGRELGVKYVVEGSVRKAGNRVRITAQLVEAATGNHLWAERYDRVLEDIFAVQDEVVREIATAVPGQLDAAAFNQIQRRSSHDPTAYECVLRGERLRHHDWGSVKSTALFEQGIEADPQCARAYANLADWHAYSILAHCAPADEARRLTRSFADKALQIEPNDPVNLVLIAEAYWMAGDLEPARRCIDKAITLNPNHHLVMLYAADVLAWLGDVNEALRWRELHLRHDPLSAQAADEGSFEVFYLAERYVDAIESISGWHSLPIHLLAESAAAHAQAGRLEEAAALRKQFESRLSTNYTINDHVSAQLKMCAHQKHRDLWLKGYRKAGFEV